MSVRPRKGFGLRFFFRVFLGDAGAIIVLIGMLLDRFKPAGGTFGQMFHLVNNVFAGTVVILMSGATCIFRMGMTMMRIGFFGRSIEGC